ncbi:phosphoribosyltransferase family protein [Actinoplanes sp. NPDC020271]|uniref:phosphoribosyltransferase family protein n=1 Tax=Actinoplanes sp. NPDC020271 TaxID=3363896 RepID=UPI0037915095
MKNTQLINVEFYTGVDERLDLPVMLSPAPESSALDGANVLIVDDVADTGATVKLVGKLLLGARGAGADRGDLREAAVGGEARLRVGPHRQVDRFPLVERAPGRHECLTVRL